MKKKERETLSQQSEADLAEKEKQLKEASLEAPAAEVDRASSRTRAA